MNTQQATRPQRGTRHGWFLLAVLTGAAIGLLYPLALYVVEGRG